MTGTKIFFTASCISSLFFFLSFIQSIILLLIELCQLCVLYAVALPNHHRITLRSQSTISHQAQRLCTKEYALRPTETNNVLCFAYAGQNSI